MIRTEINWNQITVIHMIFLFAGARTARNTQKPTYDLSSAVGKVRRLHRQRFLAAGVVVAHLRAWHQGREEKMLPETITGWNGWKSRWLKILIIRHWLMINMFYVIIYNYITYWIEDNQDQPGTISNLEERKRFLRLRRVVLQLQGVLRERLERDREQDYLDLTKTKGCLKQQKITKNNKKMGYFHIIRPSIFSNWHKQWVQTKSLKWSGLGQRSYTVFDRKSNGFTLCRCVYCNEARWLQKESPQMHFSGPCFFFLKNIMMFPLEVCVTTCFLHCFTLGNAALQELENSEVLVSCEVRKSQPSGRGSHKTQPACFTQKTHSD